MALEEKASMEDTEKWYGDAKDYWKVRILECCYVLKIPFKTQPLPAPSPFYVLEEHIPENSLNVKGIYTPEKLL